MYQHKCVHIVEGELKTGQTKLDFKIVHYIVYLRSNVKIRLGD